MTEEQNAAILEVANAAAILFRPPYRRGAEIMDERERHDWGRLYRALCRPECPIDMGEELT